MSNHYNVVNVTELINPHFYELWLSEQSHVIAKGGRSSFKSSVIALKLVEMKLEEPMSNFICLRKVANTLYKSVYSQIRWAISMFGAESQFRYGKAPMEIIHKQTGTGFYFSGVDEPEKLKSMIIPVGYVRGLFYEELAEFNGVEDIDIVEDTFIRQDLPDGKQVRVFFAYNPPRNPYNWTNEWTDGKVGDPNYLIHHSTYLDDELGILSKQMLNKIEEYKKNDYDYWNWMYNGAVIGMGDNVYNMNLFKPLDTLPSNDRIIGLYYSIDSGHSVSATTCGCFGLTAKGNVILLNTYYYSPVGRVEKKAPSDLAKDLNEFMKATSTQEQWIGARIMNRTIDSADGALRNQYYKDYRQHLNPVKKIKKVDMIDRVHNLLAQGKFYYLVDPYKANLEHADNNSIFIEEHRKFQWDEKTMNSDAPKVIEVDDHTADMFIYLCMDNAHDFRLDV